MERDAIGHGPQGQRAHPAGDVEPPAGPVAIEDQVRGHALGARPAQVDRGPHLSGGVVARERPAAADGGQRLGGDLVGARVPGGLGPRGATGSPQRQEDAQGQRRRPAPFACMHGG